MRILIYGMQSSGASTLALLLAQKPGSAAFVDIWAMYAAPSLPDQPELDVIAKVVATTAFPLALHQQRFRPDHTILLLRHPQANYESLESKTYRNHSGLIEEKFAVLDQVFRDTSAYDSLLHYEDLIFDPQRTGHIFKSIGWGWNPNFLKFRRNQKQIEKFNNVRFPDIAERLEYGFGNYHSGRLRQSLADLTELGDSAATVRAWCPAVVEHYESLTRQRGAKWRLPQKALHVGFSGVSRRKSNVAHIKAPVPRTKSVGGRPRRLKKRPPATRR
jgi:hypothetical protein